jgi:RecB family exonuclease
MLYKKPLWTQMLNSFFENQIEHFKSGWQVLFSEYDTLGEINGLKFKGRIDRLDKKDDNYLVIDYKSGSTKSINSKNSDGLVDFQMNIYDKLLQKPNSKIDFAYIEILNSGKLEYLKAKEEKEEKLLEHIEYLKTLKSFDAVRCDNLQLCRNCSYRLLCHRGEFL